MMRGDSQVYGRGPTGVRVGNDVYELYGDGRSLHPSAWLFPPVYSGDLFRA